MRERKNILDMHMNILAALLTGIKDRQLDNFFEIEENIMKLTRPQVLEILKDPSKGNEPVDKLRLFMIWFLSTEQDASRAEWEEFVKVLTEAGVDAESLPYIQRYVILTTSYYLWNAWLIG